MAHHDEDDASSSNTENVLLDSQIIAAGGCCSQTKAKRPKCAPICYLVTSAVFALWGIATLIWTPYEILMNERLRMMPGFPAYDWWKNPPDEVLVKVYIFNVTNSERFLNGTDPKLNMAEIGPIVFMEKLTHDHVIFNQNGTMTYTATRKAIYLPKQNTIDLNATLTIPNWALLGVASFLSDQSFFVKLGFNLLTRAVKPQPFVTLTIDQLLWNFTDPMMDAARKIAPHLVPIQNLGILSRIYTDFTNNVTVFIGTKHGHAKFFLIDKYDGVESLPNYGEKCRDRVAGSTEGVAYPQYITKDMTLKYWRKTLCKNAILHHDSDVIKYGVRGYRYVYSDDAFNRTLPSASDCYKGEPALPNGLSDVSKCHFGFPLASSFPHYLHGDVTLRSYVTGLTPNVTQHGSFLIVEPATGVPMESRARSQSNLIVRKLSGFNELVTPFSDLAIPMFWLEYGQVGLPWYISTLVYFQVNLLPILQRFFTAFLLVASVIFFCLAYRYGGRRRLATNKAMIFESEAFIRKP